MIERKSADERPAGAKALIIIQALAARDPDPEGTPVPRVEP